MWLYKYFSKDNFISKAGGAFAIKVSGAFLGFLVHILMARSLGASEYGYYIYALNWVFTLSIIASLGLHLPIIRYVAQYEKENKPELISGLTRWAHGVVILSSLLLGILYFLAVNIFPSEDLAIDYPVIAISTLLLPALVIIQTNKSIMFAKNKSSLGMIPDNIIKNVIIFIILASVYFFYSKQLRALEAMVIVVVSGAVTAIFSFIFLFYIHKSRGKKTANPKPRYNAKEWLYTSLPFLLVALAETIISRVDILILGIFATPSELGIYASACLLVGSIKMIPQAIESVTGPKFARFFAEEKLLEAQELLTNLVRALSVVVFLMAAVVIFFGGNLLSAFGRDFTAGKAVLFVLVLEPLVYVSIGSAGQLLGLSGNQSIYAKLGIISGVVAVTASLILIPQYGVIGAAMSRVILAVLTSSSMGYFVWKKVGIVPGLIGRRATALEKM